MQEMVPQQLRGRGISMIPIGNAPHAQRWKEAQRQEREKCFLKLREVSKRNKNHQDLVALYDKLNVVFNGELPPGNDHVGFLNVKEYNNCTGEKQ